MEPPVGLEQALPFYLQPDAVIFQRQRTLDAAKIAVLCGVARQAADRLHDRHGTRSAFEIARQLGVDIVRRRWQTAGGRILYLGECSVCPPHISLNTTVIRQLARALAGLPWEDGTWCSQRFLEEATVAHELYHIVERRHSSPAAELAAHAFTRALLAMPFSPLFFHQTLVQI